MCVPTTPQAFPSQNSRVSRVRAIFIVVGFLLGALPGAVGIYRLVARFLIRLDALDRERARQERETSDREEPGR